MEFRRKDMDDIIEFASGSVIGRDHLYVGTGRRKVLVGKSNQDAHLIFSTEDYFMALVLDGCGSGSHSEVGSKVVATLLMQAFRKYLMFHAASENMFQRVRGDVLAYMRVLANGMGSSLSQIITDYFLFTVVGVYIDRSYTVIFSHGDGVYYVDGKMTELGPFPNNAPPYMAYGITGSPFTTEHPKFLEFQIQTQLPTDEVENLLIGTDGILHMVEAEDKTIPGRTELIGPVSQFWTDGRYFENAFAVQRRLSVINRDHVDIDWEGRKITEEIGRLKDDTTLVVVRRLKS